MKLRTLACWFALALAWASPALAQTYAVGDVTPQRTAVPTVCLNATTGLATGCSGVPATPSSTTALAANQIIKASPGTLYSFEVQADSTLCAAAWWVMIYNATSAPADGAVTPIKSYAVPAGTCQVGGTFAAGGVAFSTGIVIGDSTTGPFTKTASTHAYISGDFN